MEERSGIRAPHSANYGAMGQPYEPNYLTNPDLERSPLLPGSTNYPDGKMASAAMNPAMNPAHYAAAGAAALTNPAIGTDGPTAPLPEWTNIPGYEGMGTSDNSGKFLPPPDLGPMPGAVPSPTNINWTVPFISEDVARKALLDYAKRKCCYGSAPAVEMTFHELRPYNTYRYRLETFTESRACNWVTKPFTSQSVDSPAFEPAPLPWEIPVQIPTMFQDQIKKMPVPRTSSVKTCPQCLGTCRTACRKCHGTRRVRCQWCNGTGRRVQEACAHCKGCGTESCTTCNHSGYVKCQGCSGRGQIVNYIELTVTWKNNVYEFVADHMSEFPTELFKTVNGEKIFSDEQMLLPPLINFTVPSINQASQNGLQQHYSQFSSSCRMLRQRHSIEWLPLTKVEYNWRENRYNYFVYGKENSVYTDNYPQKCCCAVM